MSGSARRSGIEVQAKGLHLEKQRNDVAIRIGTNIASLQAQTQLARGTDALSDTFQRLSSGLRVNKASDDAAGLAVASSLNADTRVYTQAVRNVNDALSLLNVSEGALKALGDISIRQRELATQAANGAYTSTQRSSMDAEANELVEEFNRIVRSTSFNGIHLFDSSFSELRVQCGYGVNGSISFAVSGELARSLGEATFGSVTTYSGGAAGVAVGDVNRDGIPDIVTNEWGVAGVYIGKGDGSFYGKTNYTIGNNSLNLALGDFNGDGSLDIVTANYNDNRISVLIGKGDGTFFSRVSYSTGTGPTDVAVGDLNGDGVPDIVATDSGTNSASVFIGTGDGSFNSRVSYSTRAAPGSVALGDVNGDEILDMVVTDGGDYSVSVFQGNGDGTFKDKVAYATNMGPTSVQLGDLNGDGALDMVTCDWNYEEISVFIGTGDGTFGSRKVYDVDDNPRSVVLGDVDGDGVLDMLVMENYTEAVLPFLGNGDGTFRRGTSFARSAGSHVSYNASLADLNNDGVLDLAVGVPSGGVLNVFLGNAREETTISPLDLTSVSGAREAMGTIDSTLQRIALELGAIGSMQSRLAVALNTLNIASENFSAASARIMNADIADESSSLVRTRILQQSAAAVLAQANQLPGIALKLLKSG